jgi:UDP-N-acetylmuramoylalanine--D-glutamate ligase
VEVAGKNILVVGLGITGVALARFLKNRGAKVTVTDQASEEILTSHLSSIRSLDIQTELGHHQLSTFKRADLIVLSPGVPHLIPPIKEAKTKGVPVCGEIELASWFIPEPIVAITGTNGKTTTTALLGEMLEQSGFKVFVGGNIGNPLIDYVHNEEKADIVVVEVSSFQLDTIDTFRPKVGILLNISEDHLDRYPDLNAYAEAKGRLFENQQPGDIAVLNGADRLVGKLSKKISSQKLFFNAPEDQKDGATLASQNIVLNLTTSSPMTRTVDLSRVKLAGKHNMENASAACLAALACGGTLEGIQTALNHFKGFAHRLEYVATINGARYYNDSKATNVDAVTRALEAFTNPIVLIMGGRDKGGSYQKLKDRIGRNTKKLIVFGEAKEVIQTALGGVTSTSLATTMEEAVFQAYQTAKPGDVVLLSPACSSFDMYRNYQHRGENFYQAVAKLK